MSAKVRATACDPCLRRALLVAFLAPRIAALLDARVPRVPGLLRLSDDELIGAAGGGATQAAHAYLASLSLARERRRIAAREVGVVCRHSDAYPSGLRDLHDPPAALFVRGRERLLARLTDEPSVAVVGTRRPSPYGSEVAYRLGRGLGAAGVIVVSGLALGIDATAHRGCLDGNGTPVAVLACGPDLPYPRRHRALHRRVCEEGLVVSELPPGAGVVRWAFPARNRIMAALAAMTLVVEAAQPSGSLITADFARDMGRIVGAVPGRITWRMALGTNALLRDGAAPITKAQDVLDELFGIDMRRAPSLDPQERRPRDGPAAAVLDAVEAGLSVDEIAAAAGLPASEVRALLGRLEVEGWIVKRDLAGWERRAS